MHKKPLPVCLASLVVVTLAACAPSTPAPAPAGPDSPPPIPTDPAQPGQEDVEQGGEQQAVEESAGPTPTVDINCTETNPHPVGESIAETYGREYEEVMTWFCLGDTFDDILLALETSEQSGLRVEDLLDRNREIGWDALWEELGIEGLGE